MRYFIATYGFVLETGVIFKTMPIVNATYPNKKKLEEKIKSAFEGADFFLININELTKEDFDSFIA